MTVTVAAVPGPAADAPSGRLSTWSERAAKVVLLASTILAIAGEVTIGFRYVPGVAWIVPAIAIGVLIVARRRLAFAAWPVLGTTFVAPALLWVGVGTYPAFQVLWYAGLLGLIAADRELLDWHVPASWRPALACWVLVVACSWPIVVGRELEWNLAHLYAHAIPISGTGFIARNEVEWIFGVVAAFGIGVLWLDWLFSIYESENAFRRSIVMPLIVSWTLAMLVGVYQLTIDRTLFTFGYWVVLKRVPGPLLDANGFGMVAALWGPSLAALALSATRGPRGVAAALGALALSMIGVWGSGSRNGFVVAVSGAAALLVIVFRDREFAPVRMRMAAALGAAAALVAGVVVLARIPVIGPVNRILELLQGRTVGQFFYQFWDRAQYGSAALEAIRRWPLVGTGIGTFHTLVADIWYSAGYVRLPPDNAQSWYRHQFAEVGALGSIGWIAWLTLVCITVLAPVRSSGSPVVRVTRVMIVLLGLVELVGIPTQVFTVAFSFLTLLAWHVNSRRDSLPAIARHRWPGYTWIAVWGIVLLHVGLTIAHARGDLRLPNRAVWGKFDYEDGFYADGPLGAPASQARFTGRDAVAVLQASAPILRVTVWLPVAVPDTRPIHADVWIDAQHVINERVRDKERVVRYVPVQPGTRLVLETHVSSTFHASGDARDYGLAIQWEFVDRTPSD